MRRLIKAEREHWVMNLLLPFLLGILLYVSGALLNAVLLAKGQIIYGGPIGLMTAGTCWLGCIIVYSLYEAGRWNLALTMGITRRQIGVYSFLRQLTMNCLFYLVLLVLWDLENRIMGNIWKPGLGVETWICDIRWIPALILGTPALKLLLTLIAQRWGSGPWLLVLFVINYTPVFISDGHSVPAFVWIPAVLLMLTVIPVLICKMEAK